MGKVKIELHKKEIDKVATLRGVLRQIGDVAGKVEDSVQSATSGSRYLAPYGKKMVREEIDRGVRVGTTWGPAVPIEYGTIDTPAHRFLTKGVERSGARFR